VGFDAKLSEQIVSTLHVCKVVFLVVVKREEPNGKISVQEIDEQLLTTIDVVENEVIRERLIVLCSIRSSGLFHRMVAPNLLPSHLIDVDNTSTKAGRVAAKQLSPYFNLFLVIHDEVSFKK
jgi:hypothetical protein